MGQAKVNSLSSAIHREQESCEHLRHVIAAIKADMDRLMDMEQVRATEVASLKRAQTDEVCMYACMYVRMHVCIYLFLSNVCMYVCMGVG